MDDLIDKALKIAVKAHEGQVDKGGNPYILRPVWVALHFDDDEKRVAALLHDVVEDSDITLDDLKNEGLPNKVIEALDCLTRKKNESYFDYIFRNSKNHIAKSVKYYDLIHNADLSRIKNPNEKDEKRRKKYLFYLDILCGFPDGCYTYFLEAIKKIIDDVDYLK